MVAETSLGEGLMAATSKRHGGVAAGVSGSRAQLLLTALGTQGSSAKTALPRLTSALAKRGALKPQLLRALEGLLGGGAGARPSNFFKTPLGLAFDLRIGLI